MIHQTRSAKFSLGQIVATPAALSVLQQAGTDPSSLLSRHVRGDWGDLCDEDKQLNDAAVDNGERLLSSYQLRDQQKVWVITERDRSVTTILLPSDY